MTDDIRQRLRIPAERLDDINAVLLDPETRVVDDLLAVVERHGGAITVSSRPEHTTFTVWLPVEGAWAGEV